MSRVIARIAHKPELRESTSDDYVVMCQERGREWKYSKARINRHSRRMNPNLVSSFIPSNISCYPSVILPFNNSNKKHRDTPYGRYRASDCRQNTCIRVSQLSSFIQFTLDLHGAS